MISRVVVCGSKPYLNVDFDPLSDSMQIIVRNNMLLPGDGYGDRESDYQVLNSHVFNHYKSDAPLEKWISFYHKKYKMPIKHLSRFKKYITESTKTQFVNFHNNNIEVFRNHLAKNNINLKLVKELRCGFSFIGECLKAQKIPILIGFSLIEQDFSRHAYNRHSSGACHDKNQEIKMLKLLHERGEIDASFCALRDEKGFVFDTEILKPTEASKQILKEVYNL